MFLNDFANLIGFSSFFGMVKFFIFLIVVFLFGFTIYKGQKKG